MKSDKQHSGFTLIEILVSFFISATSLGLLYSIHANSTKAQLLQNETLVASELADSLLAEYSVVTIDNLSLEPTGVFEDKFAWTISTGEYSNSDQSSTSSASTRAFPLIQLTINIHWQSRDSEASLEISTLRPVIDNNEVL